MAAVSSAAALRGTDYENGLRGGPGSGGGGEDVGDDETMGRGGLDLDLELLGPGRRIRRIGGRIATGRRSGGRGSTESGGAGVLEEMEEEEMEEEEPGELGPDPAIEDPELEAIKARVREMEEEAVKLKELQNEVEKQMNMSPPPGNAGPVIMSLEEKMEADARSIYVGNVDYGATAEELEAHFHGCGSVNRVTILCDKFTGHPKGFAYIEFSDKESVRTSMALDESLFRGRQIKVVPKRTNRPGISTTDRGYPRARFRARAASYSSRSRFYSGYTARPRGRVYRGRARVTSWYSPY
ncbi:polyadenylate-binding protein 2 [Bufo gargarizans]|uniref:polyadenylate-binding protein 2 n=1 Tax=Bufo gargarizans TaxID=30331 RepID=UPI001CF1B233|nr:polyadenylate-binding protein 2 [Bufo gargarizans]